MKVRLFCDSALAMGKSVILPETPAHHARDVLRLTAGDEVTLLNGFGGEYTARLTLVTDSSRAVYSGMVPGFVAGQYRLEDIEIDVERLARKAGAEWLEARVTGLDPGTRRLHVDRASPVAYATVSFDVGSTVSGLRLLRLLLDTRSTATSHRR